MKIYLVRLKENREAVGFFWALNLGELWDVIDEVCDPNACEYAQFTHLGPGGIGWSGKTRNQFPPRERGEEIIFNMIGASTYGGAAEAMFFAKSLMWKPMPSASRLWPGGYGKARDRIAEGL